MDLRFADDQCTSIFASHRASFEMGCPALQINPLTRIPRYYAQCQHTQTQDSKGNVDNACRVLSCVSSSQQYDCTIRQRSHRKKPRIRI